MFSAREIEGYFRVLLEAMRKMAAVEHRRGLVDGTVTKRMRHRLDTELTIVSAYCLWSIDKLLVSLPCQYSGMW